MSFKKLEMFLTASNIQFNNYYASQNDTNLPQVLIIYLMRELKKNNIKCNYNINNNSQQHGKFILSAEKDPDNSSELSALCNGVIFDYHTLMPLCIPPLATVSQYKTHEVNQYLEEKKYDIFKLVDGTVMSLYWCPYKKDWCLSTTHGLDVDNIRFNNMTYGEIFREVINDIKPKKTGNPLLDFDPHTTLPFYRCLNKSKSYTFCITHPNLHPLQTNSCITIICSVNLTSYPNTTYDWEPEEFKDLIATQDKLAYQEKFIIPTDTNFGMQDIYYLSNQSVNMYLNKQKLTKQLQNNPEDQELQQTLNSDLYKKLTPFYGFILRSKESMPRFNNIIITSLLMARLKNLLYNSKFIYYLKKWENIDRNKFIELFHMLSNSKNKNLYSMLFPNAINNWIKMADIMAEIGENIIKNKVLENIDAETNPHKIFIYKFAKNHFDNDKSLQNEKQVMNFLMSKELVIAYYYLVHTQ